jgi:hypothetical protein
MNWARAEPAALSPIKKAAAGAIKREVRIDFMPFYLTALV